MSKLLKIAIVLAGATIVGYWYEHSNDIVLPSAGPQIRVGLPEKSLPVWGGSTLAPAIMTTATNSTLFQLQAQPVNPVPNRTQP